MPQKNGSNDFERTFKSGNPFLITSSRFHFGRQGGLLFVPGSPGDVLCTLEDAC